MGQTYPPLKLLEIELFEESFLTVIDKKCQLETGQLGNISAQKFIEFVLSSDFLDDEYHGEYEKLNQVLFKETPALLEHLGILGISLQAIKQHKVNPLTEWADMLLTPVVLELWAKNKQVFKPDISFAEALLHTKKIEISNHMLRYLPCNLFYIDLLDIDIFPQFVGVFIYILAEDSKVTICGFFLSNDYKTYSSYLTFHYSDLGLISLDKNQLSIIIEHTASIDNIRKISSEMIFFILQTICYLSSKEPEITQSPQTKTTYRPSKIIRNKFSEVQMWDVGIRYGTSYREKTKQIQKVANKSISNKLSTRHAPVPHFRCAHWQHYWVGKGRKQCVVKWIEPVFVGGTSISSDVVIHNL